LEFAFKMFGFVTDDQFPMARNAELYPHHGRNCARAVFRALVDANPAGNQPAVDFLQFGDACAIKLLRPFRAISRFWYCGTQFPGVLAWLSPGTRAVFLYQRVTIRLGSRGGMEV